MGLRSLLPTDGQVVRVDLPGQVSGRFDWRRQTRLDFVVDKSGISVSQDGRLVGSKRFSDGFSLELRREAKVWNLKSIKKLLCKPNVRVVELGQSLADRQGPPQPPG